MEFLAWHYSKGLDFYISRWVFYIRYISHFFRLDLLLTSLFAPWKRLVEVDKSPGFNLQRYFETLTFNLISRGIGAAVRVILFCAGLVILAVVLFGGAFGIGLWIVFPVIGLPPYLRYIERPDKYMEKLIFAAKKSVGNPLDVILSSRAGAFFLGHIGIAKDVLLKKLST